jgi:hypothetical protein
MTWTNLPLAIQVFEERPFRIMFFKLPKTKTDTRKKKTGVALRLPLAFDS